MLLSYLCSGRGVYFNNHARCPFKHHTVALEVYNLLRFKGTLRFKFRKTKDWSRRLYPLIRTPGSRWFYCMSLIRLLDRIPKRIGELGGSLLRAKLEEKHTLMWTGGIWQIWHDLCAALHLEEESWAYCYSESRGSLVFISGERRQAQWRKFGW